MSIDLSACSPLPLRLRISPRENNVLELIINNNNPIFHKVAAFIADNIITLTSESKIDLEQSHVIESYECNYFTLTLTINNNILDLEKSKINFGFQKDNSCIEVATLNLIDHTLYEPVNETFSKAFGTFVSAGSFMQYLISIYPQSYLQIFSELISICKSSAILKQGTFEPIDFENKTFNFCIVRDSDNQDDIEDELLNFIVTSQNQYCSFINLNNRAAEAKTSLNEITDVDVFIFITCNDIEDYNTNSAIKVKCSPGLFSSTKSLCKQLVEISKQTKKKKLKDRKNLQKEGACSGPKEDGSCCGGGCGKDSSKTEQVGDKCCGGSGCGSSPTTEQVKDMGCGMGENCCGGKDCGSTTNEQINGEVKIEEVNSCKGGCGSCSGIDEDLKKLNIEQTGCCQGKTDSSCCKSGKRN